MIYLATPEQAVDSWAKIEPLLNRVLDRFDYGSDSNDVMHDVIVGSRQIWCINDYEAVAVTQICTLPKFSVLDIPMLAGDNVDQWLGSLVEQLTKYAKFSGCRYVDGFGRKGWTRKLEEFGFKPYSYDVRLEV